MKVYAHGVTTAYRIKDVAERSGFSAATLRYYEEIGLLPESSRTPGGYRIYDDHTLDRLAFIARAKQIGCSLDEIAELAVAWDGGSCGPVQDRLRIAVAEKLDAAQRQIGELMTLTSELQRAAASLEGHRPDGPCDDTCGCFAEPPTSETGPQPRSVSLVSKPLHERTDGVPIACTLASESLQGRLEDWRRLLGHVGRREHVGNGVRAEFASTVPLHELIRLTAAEHDCCQFLNFAITVDRRGIALEVTAADDAISIVHALFGASA